MKALVAVDAQLFCTPDGRVWAKTLYGYNFWIRYLNVFDSIDVVSRMEEVPEYVVKDYIESSGPNVSFRKLPMAIGMKQYLQRWGEFVSMARHAVEGEKCAIIRIPSVSAFFVERQIINKHIPYCVEVVVDPETAYAENIGAKILFKYLLKKSVVRANGASYVTQHALQAKYPAYASRYREDSSHFETYYSSITLESSYFYRERDFKNHSKQYKIVHTANNFGNYVKGHKEVILVVKKLREDGYDVSVEFIGDGVLRREFEAFAQDNNVQEHVFFSGLLSSSNEVREHLINADIFLFPTRAEGLPRAVIEAMAVGLPCVSTPVNGIPELLENEFMFEPTDVIGFAKKIEELIDNPLKMEACSIRNIKKAEEYQETLLTERRNEFYRKLSLLALKE